ncbi:OsmC family peroxiredoxin, partial [Nocardia elegans]|nr:OsmC family peroxiredoxin [Nocardia elegans]
MAATTPTTSSTSAPAEPTTLWVERTGTRAYTGRSSRGAEVKIAS